MPLNKYPAMQYQESVMGRKDTAEIVNGRRKRSVESLCRRPEENILPLLWRLVPDKDNKS